MTTPYYEIVTYTVSDAEPADRARASARNLLAGCSGFLHWSEFSGADDVAARVDLVAWASKDEALAAAKAVGSSPEFAAFRVSVSNLISMEHYRLPEAAPHPVISDSGVEIGRFRLKSGVSEAAMRAAYDEMVSQHLARQPGWRRQHLVKLDDDVFVDLAFADSRTRAEVICAGWAEQAKCDAFLALIDPVSMEFGTVL